MPMEVFVSAIVILTGVRAQFVDIDEEELIKEVDYSYSA